MRLFTKGQERALAKHWARQAFKRKQAAQSSEAQPGSPNEVSAGNPATDEQITPTDSTRGNDHD